VKPAKRIFDVAGAGLGVVVLAPLLSVLALLIKLEDGGPVFFRQARVGCRGRPFRIWKFRTMVSDAEARGLPLTAWRDPRVTRVGAWLRRLKLDELPQLLNVLAGDMSLVGPRPEVPRYVAAYTPLEREVLKLVPGMTDEASLRYADEESMFAGVPDPERRYVEVILPDKVRLNLAYAARATVWTDCRLILATVGRLAFPAQRADSPARSSSPRPYVTTHGA
jgi:lipopolysaccharide/colanic/teichoic acid biosynthesis glycosyltransferase